MTKIVSIHSFRGGTGKSNTTANLSAQVALTGKSVAVFDTDIQSPGIHVPFGITGDMMTHTLNGFLRGEYPIEDAMINIGNHTGQEVGRKKLAGTNLNLVPASIRSDEITRILREGYDFMKLNEGIQTLRKKMDYVFIDTHPGLNEETLLSVAVSDILILILRPDQQDFQGTAVTVDVVRQLDVKRLYLLVNKALIRYDHAKMKTDIEALYGERVAAVLPLTEDMVDMQSGDIFSLAKPDHPWSLGIKQLTRAVLTEE